MLGATTVLGVLAHGEATMLGATVQSPSATYVEGMTTLLAIVHSPRNHRYASHVVQKTIS